MPGRRRAHAGRRRLRGRAARLGAGRRAEDLEGRARPPAKNGGRRRVPPPRRVPRPLRRRASRARTSRSRSSSPATRSRSPASRSARASRARSSGTTSTAARSRTARTTSASRARSAPRRRRRASSRACKMAGRMGGKRVTQVGLTVHAVDAEQQPAARQGRRPRPEERPRRDQGGRRDGRAQGSAPRAARPRRTVSLEAAVFGAEVKPHLVHEAVRAELNARRQGTRAAKSRGLVSGGRSSRGARRAPAAPAPGTIRAPQFTGGGVVFPPSPRDFDHEGEPEGAPEPRYARALRDHVQAGTLALLDVPRRSTTPSTKRRSRAHRELGQGHAAVVVVNDDEDELDKSFRNLDRVLVTTSRPSSRSPRSSGRARCSSPRRRLPLVQGRAS